MRFSRGIRVLVALLVGGLLQGVGIADLSAGLCPQGKKSCHYSARRNLAEETEALGARLGSVGEKLTDEVIEAAGVTEVDIDSDAKTTWVRTRSGRWALESRYDDGRVEHLYTVEVDAPLLAEEGFIRPRDEFCENDLSNATRDEPCVAVGEPKLFPKATSTGRGTSMAIRDEVARRCSLARIVERVTEDAGTCHIEATKRDGERKAANVVLFQPHRTMSGDVRETIAPVDNELTTSQTIRLRPGMNDGAGQRLMLAGNPILFGAHWPLFFPDQALCFGFDCEKLGNDGSSFANGILLDNLFFDADAYRGNSCLKTPGLQPLCQENWNEHHRTTLLSPLGMGRGKEGDYKARVTIDLEESDEAAFVLSGKGSFVLRDMDIVLRNGGLIRVTSPCVHVILERTTIRVQPGSTGRVPSIVRYAFEGDDAALCEPGEGQIVRGGAHMDDPSDLFRLQVAYEDKGGLEPPEISATRVTRITGKAPGTVFSFPSGMPLLGRTMFRRLRVDMSEWNDDAVFTRVDDGSAARTIRCLMRTDDRCELAEKAGWPIMILPTGEIESGFDAENGREIKLDVVRAIADGIAQEHDSDAEATAGDDPLPEGVRLFTADGRRIVVVGEELECPEGMERSDDPDGAFCVGEYGTADVDESGDLVVTCDAGAVPDDDGVCVPDCEEEPNTAYDRSRERCEPLPGYEWDEEGEAVFQECPGEAIPDVTGTRCVCRRGPLTDAVWNGEDDRWECHRPCPENATRVEGVCRCDAGFLKSGGACLSEEDEAATDDAPEEDGVAEDEETTNEDADLADGVETTVLCADGSTPEPLTGRCPNDEADMEAEADAATEETTSNAEEAASGCSLVAGAPAAQRRSAGLLLLFGCFAAIVVVRRLRA